MSYFPELKRAETNRLTLIVISMLSPLWFGLAAGFIFDTMYLVLLGALLGLMFSIFLVKLISKKLKVYCPVCSSLEINENYSKSLRGSNKNVEHYCKACGSKFIDGHLLE